MKKEIRVETVLRSMYHISLREYFKENELYIVAEFAYKVYFATKSSLKYLKRKEQGDVNLIDLGARNIQVRWKLFDQLSIFKTSCDVLFLFSQLKE